MKPARPIAILSFVLAGVAAAEEPPRADPAVTPAHARTPAAANVTAVVREAEVSKDVRAAMLQAVTRFPDNRRWSGEAGPRLFALSAVPLPAGNLRGKATPQLLSAAQMLANEEIVLTRAVLDLYGTAGLSDTVVLRTALARCAGELSLTGRVRGLILQAQTHGDFAIAYVVCDAAEVTGYLRTPASLEPVRAAYREVMHEQMRDLMKQGEWKKALGRWAHLHERDLLSPELCRDAARCFLQVKEPRQALGVIREGLGRFGNSASAECLEQYGDLALGLGPEGEVVARAAYEKASDRLRDSRTDGRR